MLVLLISILIGIFTIVIIDIIEYIFLGDRGKKFNLTNHFNQLKHNRNGNQQNKLRKASIKQKHTARYGKSKKQYNIYVLPMWLAFFLISSVIFRSLFMGICISMFSFSLPGILFERSQKRIRVALNLQLRDALYSMTSSLKAGLSLNSALIKCVDDLERIHTLKNEQFILQEFKKIRFDINTGIPVEDALRSFRDRIRIDDADDFVNSILIVRQKGGNLIEVMDNVTSMINDRIQIGNEINILTTGKRMEANMLTITPIIMVALLSVLSPDYMGTMLNTALGKIFIILGFIMLAANYYMGRKIVNINV